MKDQIVIASTLKSIFDVRSFHKIAQSLAQTNKYEINIIGNQEKSEKKVLNIKFFPHQLKRNNWIKRIIIKWIILYKIIKIKPKFTIITTHELLTITPFIRALTKSKIIYDIQENYNFNILYLSKFPLKKWLANYVRTKEKIFSFFISQFFLAEKCYENELDFVHGKYLILENKAYQTSLERSEKSGLNLLFSGTISVYSGIYECMNIFRLVNEKIEDISLTIIGQIHNQQLHEELITFSKKYPNKIILKISKNTIPHVDILKEICNANLGIISYQPNKVNQNKIPTKLYEYSRYQLPYVVQEKTIWYQKSLQLGNGIPVNFSNPDIEKLVNQLKELSINPINAYSEYEIWEKESYKLINYFK